MIPHFNNWFDQDTQDIWNYYQDDDFDFILDVINVENDFTKKQTPTTYTWGEYILVKKKLFLNLNNNFKKINIIQKTIPIRFGNKKYFSSIRGFFKRMPFNKMTKQKSAPFLTYLFLYFFTTHDLYFFSKKLTTFLQKTDRKFQFRIVRQFRLFNKFGKTKLFNYFNIGGLYFRVSGKFGGVGGSKKMRKTMVWGRPGFSNRAIKLHRSITTVWSHTGTTTWSIYASFI